jgi:branched-subunit amino acid ABC-type transport system permease component
MRTLAPGFLLILALLLHGCAGSIDSQQLDLCRRVLPALHPDGTELREMRFASAGPQAVRIEYSAREPESAARIGTMTCHFGGARLDKERLELVGVDTARGSLGDARLLFLKRFWLAPGSAADAPPPPVPEIPTSVAYAAQQAINAIALAAIYGLLATAYSLIYGLVGRINLAFGEIAVIGAYAAIGGVAAVVVLGFDDPIGGLALALLVSAGLTGLWSWYLGRAVVGPLHASYREGQPILVATAAIAISIQEFLRLFQGVRERWLPPFFSDPLSLVRSGRFVVTVTPMQIVIAAAALCAAGALLMVMARSRFGRQWRAFADDPKAAAMLGVAPDRLLAATFLLAGLNAGLAGWIVATYYGNVSSSMGTALGLKALLAAIVGGIGRVEGALLGGVLIGLVEAFWSAYFDIASRDLVVFSLLVVMFVLRPGGLFGMSGPTPREV